MTIRPGCCSRVIKDLLYQCYVRKARLQQAIVVRRVSVDQAERKNA
jgi:hypothetical protein